MVAYNDQIRSDQMCEDRTQGKVVLWLAPAVRVFEFCAKYISASNSFYNDSEKYGAVTSSPLNHGILARTGSRVRVEPRIHVCPPKQYQPLGDAQ